MKRRRKITIPFQRITRKKTLEEDEEKRNWVYVPYDIMILIFSKLDVVQILYCAQFVCSYWLQLSKDPQLFRSVCFPNEYDDDSNEEDSWFSPTYVEVQQLTGHLKVKHCFGAGSKSGTKLRQTLNTRRTKLMKAPVRRMVISNRILKEVVDRSCGELMEISVKPGWCRDNIIHYVVDKSNLLKSLRLEACSEMTDEGVLEACRKLPLLEKLELNRECTISKQVVQDIGRSCSRLNYFQLVLQKRKIRSFFKNRPPVMCWRELNQKKRYCEEIIFAIVGSMPQLRGLCLTGLWLTNNGLQRILDGCIHLDNLDLRGCFADDEEKDFLKTFVVKIRNLRLPSAEIPEYRRRGHKTKLTFSVLRKTIVGISHEPPHASQCDRAHVLVHRLLLHFLVQALKLLILDDTLLPLPSKNE
ncbi:hypothetical protein AQUCO_02700224v1 [Aquilegia coerulea]|uniref:F-box domain-containing protein n=1 Tax=Aquilegia coerulea TaxID=218851 RepID=A0A2G5D5T4_AQUCA|nr:hypothetical protein AQUCO_02700224v1 [Aquilegia coerulea]